MGTPHRHPHPHPRTHRLNRLPLDPNRHPPHPRQHPQHRTHRRRNPHPQHLHHHHPNPHLNPPKHTNEPHQTPNKQKPQPHKSNRNTHNQHQLDHQSQLPRPNPPHVPQTPQRHHLHHTSTPNLQHLHRTNPMPQLRPPIPPSRHARSMGRHDQQTTSSRTKTQRNQSHTPHTRPNVERSPITTYPKRILQPEQNTNPDTSNRSTNPTQSPTPLPHGPNKRSPAAQARTSSAVVGNGR